MTLHAGWPAVSGAATFQNIRRDIAGTVAKSAANVIRKGILPITTTNLVTGTATMNVAVGAFYAVIDRNGVVYVHNDGSVNVLLSSAPGSGSRWSVVYVKQRESEAPFSDGATGPVLDKVESVTSEAAARALLPAGALELAVVKVDAGSANTNAVGVTITQTVPYTAMAGGVVLLRNSTEETAWTPADGGIAYRLDLAQFRYRVSGQWRASKPSSLLGEWHVNIAPGSPGGVAMGPGGASTFAIAAEPYARAIRVTVQGGAFLSATGAGGLTCTPSTGAWAGGTNQHRVSSATIGYFTGLSYVFYMTSLAASTALTLTLASDSTVACGYDIHFTVEEI